jgi:hypothetical protein
MRVLIIHPKDPTTDFLSVSYDKGTVAGSLIESGYARLITDPMSSNKAITEAIRDADAVVMMGHGFPMGLLSVRPGFRVMVGSAHVYLLKEKKCIGVWCHANQFFSKYGLSGYSTGMVVSEDGEAERYVNMEWSSRDVTESNREFADAMTAALDSALLSDFGMFRDTLLENYKAGNPVKEYNLSNL